jgi:FKBP-type peptidyl-prolyl cis-trans isomerase 2
MTSIDHKSLNFKPLTKDNLIEKNLIIEGFGIFPGKGMEVHINFYSESEDGRFIDSTNILKEPFTFIIGTYTINPGLDFAVRSMKMGEKSVFRISPEYTFFSEEKFKNCDKKLIENLKIEGFKTKIPENFNKEELLKMEIKDAKKYQNIYYEIELIKFDKPRPKKITLNPKERMEQSNELKLEGNFLFKEKRFREAIIKYKDAQEYLKQMPNQFINDLYKKLQHSLTVNITNCHINLLEYNYALKEIENNFCFENNPKVFYFKSLCEMHLGNFEDSYKNLIELDKVFDDKKMMKNYFDDYFKFKENVIKNQKNSNKKGIFESGLYNDLNVSNNNNNFLLPKFDGKNNFCFYFDILINNDEINPLKIKFEIFDEIKINHKNLFNFLQNFVNEKQIKNKIINFKYDENIILLNNIKIENVEENFKKNIFIPNENVLLLLNYKENKEINIEININKLSDKIINNILVLGRCYYNQNKIFNLYENKINGEIKILDCDVTFNI